MAQVYGVPIRESRPATLSTCRARGVGTTPLAAGELVMLDVAGSDALTSAYTAGSKASPGTQSAASGALATVVRATEALAHGRVGVATAAVSDDQLGQFEFGVAGEDVTDVVVTAQVVVGASATAGAALVIVRSGGVAVLTASGDGAVFATLLEAATTDDGLGPSSTINRKRVVLHSQAKAAAGDAVDLELVPADVADPDVFFGGRERWAPRFAKVTSFGSFSWAPSTTSVGLRCRFAVTKLPSAGTTARFLGTTSGSGRSCVQFDDAGVVKVDTGTSVTTIGSVAADGDHHYLVLDYAGTELTWTLDGVDGSATVVDTVSTSATTLYLGKATSSPTEPNAELILWDVEFVDTDDTDKSVLWRMDEQTGAWRNAYTKLDDAAYNASNTSGVTIATMGTVTQPERVLVHSVDGGDRPISRADILRTRNRVVAFGGKGAAGLGHFAQFSATMSGTVSQRMGCTLALSTAPSGTCIFLGRNDSTAHLPNLRRLTTGEVRFCYDDTILATSAAGALPADGVPRDLYVDFTATTASIVLDGVIVASATFSDAAWATGAQAHRIGGGSASGQAWPGSIWNALFEDKTTAANTLFYLLDEPVGVDYVDTSGNGGAAAVRNGYVSTASVPTTDGRGRPWQMGDGAPLADSMTKATATLVGAGGTLALDTIEYNGSGVASTSQGIDTTGGDWNAYAAGVVRVSLTIDAELTVAVGTQTCSAQIRKNNSTVGAARTVRAAAGEFTVFRTFSVAVGDEVDAYIGGVDALDTWTMRTIRMEVVFTPTPTAG